MKYRELKKDERLGFWHNFLYEFGLVFLIIFINSYGLIFIYNKLVRTDFSVPWISFYIILFLLTSSVICSVLVYITRARIYSRELQTICNAAQSVAKGDFSVRLDVYENKKSKNELDILKEDFNQMVDSLSSVEGMKNDFVADVSHEIKTPLSVIQGYADLLTAGKADRAASVEYINQMTSEIHKLNELVANILKLSKIENQGIIHKEKFFLDEQIRCSILDFVDKAEEKNIEFSVDLEEMAVVSDSYSLDFVWKNLIQNAVKFCGEGGKISVTLRQNEGKAVVTVLDNGAGMSEETQKHIFEKFYQGDTSHSTEGNGLGLALVKRVADKLGGNVVVESKLGKGSKFIFSIPVN